MNGLPVCTSVQHLHTCSVPEGQKMASDSLEWELQKVLSCSVGFGNLGPLEMQLVLLIAELPLQPPNSFLKKSNTLDVNYYFTLGK